MIVAAERVLAEGGVAGLTTNRIAEVAGVSIGSLYQYFPNKEAVAAALIDRYVATFVGTATKLIADNASAEPVAIVDAIGHAVTQLFRAQQPVHRHLRDLRAIAGKLEPMDRALDMLVDVVASYLRKRPEHVIDPRVAAFAIVHSVDGTVNAFAVRQQSLPTPLDDPETIGRELARMLGAYLASCSR
jgi:AcrR family transcriptional regulator